MEWNVVGLCRALSGLFLCLNWTGLDWGKENGLPLYTLGTLLCFTHFLLFTLQGGRREEGSGAPEPDQGKAGKKKKKKNKMEKMGKRWKKKKDG